MSKVKDVLLTDATGKEVAEHLRAQNVLLSVIANAGINEQMTLEEIFKIVKAGKAENIFSIGDQIVLPWTDIDTGITYQVPHDVVAFPDVYLRDGEEVPAMFLQWHYATPFGVQFDAPEALVKAPSGGYPAGTYHFSITTTWSKALAGSYQFTLTQPVPEGGLICGLYQLADNEPTTWKIETYASGDASTYIERVSVTSGSGGTDLGALIPAGSASINSIQRIGYGSNKWSQSAIRQWLNSNAGKNSWWTSQNNYDRKPDQLATKAGFLTGYDAEFVERLQEIKVTTALNTVEYDYSAGTPTEDTYDRVFLASLQQEHIVPQLADVEGSAFEYWKRASQSASPLAQGGTYPQMRTFAIENHTSPQPVRLRSAYRGHAYYTWYVNSSGNVNYSGACYAYRCAPVVPIC